MNKFLLALPGILLLSAATAFAQTLPLSTVFDIQTVPATNLAACDDRPASVGDTVRVQAIVITPGAARPSTSTPATRQIWIQDLNSNQGFHNVTLFSSAVTAPDDILNLVPGDTIEVVGTVLEYNGTSTTNPTNDGETELVPFPDQVTVIGAGPGTPPTSTLLTDVGVLNDAQRLNNLPTGEQWEGGFVEIQNVTVVAVSPFTSGGEQRVSFTVADAAGNRIEISDRFAAGRLVSGFVAPNIGDAYTSIKGIIIHNKNRCPATGANNRGYTLNPFDASHYVRGAQAPTISAIARAIVVPCSTETVAITANITDDGSVAKAYLHYAIGAGATTYDTVRMTTSGTSFTASIPPVGEGIIVKYYISATDNNNQTTNNPNVPNNGTPLFYTVRCGAPLIRDIQFTPFADGNSGLRNQNVTGVRGVVTADASADNLGQVYIQQQNAIAWEGIWLVGGPTIANLHVGDLVTVNGTVEEDFNVTRINVSSATVESSGNPVTSITLAPSQVTTYDFNTNEQYEGLLLKVAAPAAGQPLYVVDTNTAAGTSNFGEWRLGSDQFDPNQGVVIHTGYRNNTNYSSLAVSYINNLSRWGGTLTVPPVLIHEGDEFSSATGILYYGFSLLKLLPRNNGDLPDYVSMVGIKKNLEGSRFVSISPNPASGKANILISSSSLKNELKGASFLLTTMVGNSVNVAGTIAGENTSMDVSSLAPGLYNLVISGKGGIITEKLVVE